MKRYFCYAHYTNAFYLNHFFNFELFIFENEIKIDVCLLLSFSHFFFLAPRALKTITIIVNIFWDLTTAKIRQNERWWKRAIFGWLVIFEWWNKFAIFFWGLNGGSMVRKISVILSIKNSIKLNWKLKIGMYQKVFFFFKYFPKYIFQKMGEVGFEKLV